MDIVIPLGGRPKLQGVKIT